MKAHITAKTELLATHTWPGAPKHRAYLSNLHAHVFIIEIKAPVKHGDRDLEFHDLRYELEKVLSDMIGYRIDEPPTFGDMSCEQIGSEVLEHMSSISSVSVSEDGQFSAEVFREERLPTITICGSTKFKREFKIAQEDLERQGWAVFTVGFFMHADNVPVSDEDKAKLDLLHLRKIEASDAIFIVNPGGYIGDSTQSEIDYARSQGKTILSLEPLKDEEE